MGLSAGSTLRESDDGRDFKVAILEDDWVPRIPRVANGLAGIRSRL
jgi:hypothetical protein